MGLGIIREQKRHAIFTQELIEAMKDGKAIFHFGDSPLEWLSQRTLRGGKDGATTNFLSNACALAALSITWLGAAKGPSVPTFVSENTPVAMASREDVFSRSSIDPASTIAESKSRLDSDEVLVETKIKFTHCDWILLAYCVYPCSIKLVCSDHEGFILEIEDKSSSKHVLRDYGKSCYRSGAVNSSRQ